MVGVKSAEACHPDRALTAIFAGDGVKQARSPGRARYKPSNHCAGNVGLPPLNLYARVRFFAQFCTRDRGCSAHPAFPAPSDFMARNFWANLGRIESREREVMSEKVIEHGRATPAIVIARLDRATQYSRGGHVQPRSRGVLDPPHARGMTICGWVRPCAVRLPSRRLLRRIEAGIDAALEACERFQLFGNLNPLASSLRTQGPITPVV